VRDHGAVLHGEVPAIALIAAFEATTAELGYARIEGNSDIEVRIWTSGDRACVGVSIAKSLALGLGKKLAVRLMAPVRVFTASLVERAGSYDCLLDDLTFRRDGTSSVGRWGADLTEKYGQNWDDVCDGKSYFAVSALLEVAVESVLREAARETYALRAPPSLGHARLDAIASQIRLADRVEHTKMAGRECVRITNAGTTVTSFLEPGDALALAASGLRMSF